MKKVGILGMLIAAFLLSGCEELTGRTGAVAIIDLDEVARQLGRDEVIAQRVTQANQQLTNQLGEIATNLQREIDEERAALEVVTDEDEAELAQKAREANQRLAQTRQLAQQRAEEFRQAVINEFRNEVQPHAEAVAEQRGAKAIFTVAVPMIWYDDAINITDDVVTRMRETSTAPAPAPAPATSNGGDSGSSDGNGSDNGEG